MNRRRFLALTAGAAVAAERALLRAQSRLRLMAVGQSLILRDPATQFRAGFEQMRERLGGADVAFTNLEVAIRGSRARDATASGAGVAADPAVLDALRRLHVNLLSLSNNHAGDLGEAGLLSTIEETRNRGFTFAGTGDTLMQAARPGYLKTPRGVVALVAMASSAIPSDRMARETHAGVNHLAVRNGIVDPNDAARVLDAIRTAAAQADWVVVYQHDHYWAPDWQDTPEWKQRWCRECIDAGASVFVSHGVPILHGIEIYRDRPIFYGLGNFIFHISIELRGNVPALYTGAPVFQSVLADCDFDGNRLTSLSIDPITLKSDPGVGEGGYRLHGNPQFAIGTEADEILSRLAGLSSRFGTRMEIASGRARVTMPGARTTRPIRIAVTRP
jgi:poly-gamma-glutamate synthesis protein (capsule biosynthesis protein)